MCWKHYKHNIYNINKSMIIIKVNWINNRSFQFNSRWISSNRQLLKLLPRLVSYSKLIRSSSLLRLAWWRRRTRWLWPRLNRRIAPRHPLLIWRTSWSSKCSLRRLPTMNRNKRQQRRARHLNWAPGRSRRHQTSSIRTSTQSWQQLRSKIGSTLFTLRTWPSSQARRHQRRPK